MRKSGDRNQTLDAVSCKSPPWAPILWNRGSSEAAAIIQQWHELLLLLPRSSGGLGSVAAGICTAVVEDIRSPRFTFADIFSHCCCCCCGGLRYLPRPSNSSRSGRAKHTRRCRRVSTAEIARNDGTLPRLDDPPDYRAFPQQALLP